MNGRTFLAALLVTTACATHAQSPAPSQPATLAPSIASRPSAPTGPSMPTQDFDEAGNPRGFGNANATPPAGAAAPAPRGGAAPANRDPSSTRMLGAGAFDTSTSLGGALNSGTPPSWDRKSGVRKVCPPGLENRNNICAAPIGSILAP